MQGHWGRATATRAARLGIAVVGVAAMLTAVAGGVAFIAATTIVVGVERLRAESARPET